MTYILSTLIPIILASLLTGLSVYIGTLLIEKKKRKVLAEDFIMVALQEIELDIKNFLDIKKDFDPVYPMKAWIKHEHLRELSVNNSLYNYKEYRCYLDDNNISMKVFEYINLKQSFIYTINAQNELIF